MQRQQAGTGRSSQRGRPATAGRLEGENFHFSQSECGQRAGVRGTLLQPAPGPLGKEREGKMQAAVGKLLEQVAYPCLRTAMSSAQILIALGLINGMGYSLSENNIP